MMLGFIQKLNCSLVGREFYPIGGRKYNGE